MFKKNQLVTVISNWQRADVNHNGETTPCQYSVEHLVVHSCGKKQMILANEAGEVFKGRFYKPSVEQNGFGLVLPRISTEEALVVANEQAAKHLAQDLERSEANLEHYRNQGSSEAYLRSREQHIAHLRTNPIAPAQLMEDLTAKYRR